MNKTIFIVLAAAVLIGGGLYITRGRTPSAPSSDSSSAQESQAQSGTLQSLLSLNQNVSCNVSNEKSNGTVYVAGSQMRADFSVTTDGVTLMNHIIHTGNTAYVWADNSAQGIKINTEGEAVTHESVDLNQEVEFTCQPWSPDASKFTPPGAVTFTEFSTTANSESKTDMPNFSCDQIPNAQAKAACLQVQGGN